MAQATFIEASGFVEIVGEPPVHGEVQVLFDRVVVSELFWRFLVERGAVRYEVGVSCCDGACKVGKVSECEWVQNGRWDVRSRVQCC